MRPISLCGTVFVLSDECATRLSHMRSGMIKTLCRGVPELVGVTESRLLDGTVLTETLYWRARA